MRSLIPLLYAALAVWEYTEASVAHAFGATTGNRDADAILDLQGVRVEITDVVLRNVVSGGVEYFRRNYFRPGLQLRVVLVVELDQVVLAFFVGYLQTWRHSFKLRLGDCGLHRPGVVAPVIGVLPLPALRPTDQHRRAAVR